MAYRRMDDSQKGGQKVQERQNRKKKEAVQQKRWERTLLEGYYDGAAEHDEDHREEIRQALRETPENKDTGLGQWPEERQDARQAGAAGRTPMGSPENETRRPEQPVLGTEPDLEYKPFGQLVEEWQNARQAGAAGRTPMGSPADEVWRPEQPVLGTEPDLEYKPLGQLVEEWQDARQAGAAGRTPMGSPADEVWSPEKTIESEPPYLSDHPLAKIIRDSANGLYQIGSTVVGAVGEAGQILFDPEKAAQFIGSSMVVDNVLAGLVSALTDIMPAVDWCLPSVLTPSFIQYVLDSFTSGEWERLYEEKARQTNENLNLQYIPDILQAVSGELPSLFAGAMGKAQTGVRAIGMGAPNSFKPLLDDPSTWVDAAVSLGESYQETKDEEISDSQAAWAATMNMITNAVISKGELPFTEANRFYPSVLQNVGEDIAKQYLQDRTKNIINYSLYGKDF